jgi:hypothetical protein
MQPGYPSPYAPPGVGAFPVESGPPGVVVWARVYAIAFAVMYLLTTGGGAAILYVAGDLHGHEGTEAMIEGIVMLVLGPVLMALSIVAAAAPRKKWGWIVNLVIMGLGCTSCLCWPASIPLLIFWLKPEAKRWYGMT